LNENKISFKFVEGDYYDKPFTIENYNKHIKNDLRGGSNYRFLYKGYFHSDTLTLFCSSPDYGGNCYADTMNFIEKKILKNLTLPS
jgi:hypothetical protein